MPFTEPLDLQRIFINLLAGNVEIFTFLAFILIGGMAAFFRMPNFVALLMFGLFAVIMADFLPGIYLLIISIAGLISFQAISKIIK